MKKNCLECGKKFKGWGKKVFCGSIRRKEGCSYGNYLKKEKSLNEKIKALFHHTEWRINVLRRDKYFCQQCKIKGRSRSVFIFPNLPVLYVAYKKPFGDIIKKNNITNEQEALCCGELWDVSNGVTYCVNCYSKIYKKNFIKLEKGIKKFLLKNANRQQI